MYKSVKYYGIRTFVANGATEIVDFNLPSKCKELLSVQLNGFQITGYDFDLIIDNQYIVTKGYYATFNVQNAYGPFNTFPVHTKTHQASNYQLVIRNNSGQGKEVYFTFQYLEYQTGVAEKFFLGYDYTTIIGTQNLRQRFPGKASLVRSVGAQVPTSTSGFDIVDLSIDNQVYIEYFDYFMLATQSHKNGIPLNIKVNQSTNINWTSNGLAAGSENSFFVYYEQ